MKRTIFLLVLGAGAIAHAAYHDASRAKVIRLSQFDIAEKLDGKETKATVEEVTLEPGQEVLSHTHAGPVFGYVLEGEYEHALNDGPVKTLHVGEAFYEPSGCVHRVTKNPSKTGKTRLLAVILHPRGAKEVTIPEKVKKN
jgi:quercetin dioxygenase-like cupin family protein